MNSNVCNAISAGNYSTWSVQLRFAEVVTVSQIASFETGGKTSREVAKRSETCSVGKRLASASKQNRSADTAWQAACEQQ